MVLLSSSSSMVDILPRFQMSAGNPMTLGDLQCVRGQHHAGLADGGEIYKDEEPETKASELDDGK